MTRDTLIATVSEVLRNHGVVSLNNSHVDCACGWSIEPTPKPGEAELMGDFYAHVATVIADALTGDLAAAWDEGVLHGDSCPGGLSCDPRTANPYRTGTNDDH